MGLPPPNTKIPYKRIVQDGEYAADGVAQNGQHDQRLPAVLVGQGAREDGVDEAGHPPDVAVGDGEVVAKLLHLVLHRLVGERVEVLAEGVVVAELDVANLARGFKSLRSFLPVYR